MVSMDRRGSSSPDLKLFIRDVRDRGAKKRALTVRSWATIKDVKDSIQKLIHVPPSSQRLYFGPLLTSGKELPNHRTLHDAGVYRSGETLLLDIKDSSGADAFPFSSILSLKYSNDVCISSSMFDSTPKPLRALVQQARRGLAMGLKPEFVLDGSGGTYFLHDARKNRIAVFKPADEEPYAENNPRGYLRQAGQPESLRQGINPGEACLREVAAFLLDPDGVCGVPMTTLAEARHPTFNTNGARLNVSQGGAAIGAHSISPQSTSSSSLTKKAGSFQEFVPSECTMDDMSPSKISVDQVQKIAVLDIRIMNADRNAANLLVRRRTDDTLELIPIDHGYCLRSVCDVSWMDWCWLDWPQVKKPITDELKKYIENLDIEADARLLREQLNLCEEAVDYFRASSVLLKAGVKAGLTLYDIACMCCRNDNLAEVPSMMEKLFSTASELAHVAIENERWHHTAASRALVDCLSPQVETTFSNHRRIGDRIRKCSSTVEFVTVDADTEDLDLEQEYAGRAASPGMAQSSVSDSGSEDGNAADKEECEEWAAHVIADVGVDQISASIGAHREGCSGSVCSDDASSDSFLSSSPKGFWHIRPGTSPPMCGSDDGSISWSPAGSPRASIDISMCPDPPAMIGPEATRTPTVSFAGTLPSGPFIPPATVNVTKFKTGIQFEFPFPPSIQRSDSGMTRSKSYSALSAALDHAKVGSSVPAKHLRSSPAAEQYDTYRKYFHKFIDLVIVRETTAAKHQRSRR